MGFFKRWMNALSGTAPTGSDRYLPIYVFSNRCREAVVGQVDMLNELSLADEGGYYVRKVLHTSGKSRCFGQVEVEVWLDSKKHIVRNAVQGGRWLTADEYQTELDAAAARAEAEQAKITTDEEASSTTSKLE